MLKRIIAFLVLVTAVLAIPFSVSAESASYTYTASGDTMELPLAYEVKKIVNPKGISNPIDLLSYDGKTYILDQDSSHIVVLDENFVFEKEIVFVDEAGEYQTGLLTSFYIRNGKIFVSDYGNSNLFVSDMNGNVEKKIVIGEKDLGSTEFKPIKIAVDYTGCIYALSENEFRGIIIINSKGEFDSFYGAVNIDVTADLLLDTFWRYFMTDEQIDNSTQYVPGGYTDVDIDKDGFIYASRGISDSINELIRKLNPGGKNVLNYTDSFGDMDLGLEKATEYVSLCVDDDGFITALDKTRQRIFQYSPDGELLYAFGGVGSQKGLFSNAVAVASMKDHILVIDADTDVLCILKPTDFGATVRSAITLYRKAQFAQSEELWNEVLCQSGNYEFAYVGCGKIAEAGGKYKKAMELYKLGDSRENYSSALKKYRSNVLKKSFAVIMTALVVLIVGILLLKRYKEKKGIKNTVPLDERGKYSYILYIIRHPSDGFAEIRYNQKYSLAAANIIVAAWFFVSCLNFNYNGFCFNENRIEDFNIWIILFSTVGLIALFALSNVLLSSFLEGKGKFREIWIGLAYGLIPYVTWLFAELILTNVLTLEEGAFVTVFRVVFLGWTLVMCFIALMNINQYGFVRNVVAVLLTVVGILIIIFLLFLMFNLGAQIVDFFKTIAKEINYRNLAG